MSILNWITQALLVIKLKISFRKLTHPIRNLQFYRWQINDVAAGIYK